MSSAKEVVVKIPDEMSDKPGEIHQKIFREFYSGNERNFIFTVTGGKDKFALVRSQRFAAHVAKLASDASYDPRRDDWDFTLIASPVIMKSKAAYAQKEITKRETLLPLHDSEGRIKWLERQGVQHGFVLTEPAAVRTRILKIRKAGRNMAIDQTEFNGALKIIDHEKFAEAYLNGIGRNKAYGLGLIQLF